MTNFSQCKLRLRFKFGKCNNKLFNVSVIHNNIEFEILPYLVNEEIVGVYENTLILPTKIVIKAKGKNNLVDTKLDENQNIIEDMFVQITHVSLDDFELSENFLYKKMVLNTVNNEKIVTNYIGFNGHIELNFNEDNIFSQYLECNRL